MAGGDQAVRRRQEEISRQFENVIKGVRAYCAKHVNELRRPAFLLSGLLKCGCCGGNFGVVTRDRHGCRNRYCRGTCDNGHTIRRDDIERRILSGLTEKLVSANRVAMAVRVYAEVLNGENRERRAQAELDRTVGEDPRMLVEHIAVKDHFAAKYAIHPADVRIESDCLRPGASPPVPLSMLAREWIEESCFEVREVADADSDGDRAAGTVPRHPTYPV